MMFAGQISEVTFRVFPLMTMIPAMLTCNTGHRAVNDDIILDSYDRNYADQDVPTCVTH